MSSVTSICGNNKTQGFVNEDCFCIYQYPMPSESDTPKELVAYIHDVGIPAKVHMDNAKVETLSEWRQTIQHHHIKQTVTKPYLPWQNKAKHKLGRICTATHLLIAVD